MSEANVRAKKSTWSRRRNGGFVCETREGGQAPRPAAPYLSEPGEPGETGEPAETVETCASRCGCCLGANALARYSGENRETGKPGAWKPRKRTGPAGKQLQLQDGMAQLRTAGHHQRGGRAQRLHTEETRRERLGSVLVESARPLLDSLRSSWTEGSAGETGE